LKGIVIIGGGLAGLTTAINLAIHGVECTLIEKNRYPFHRVCGEYVSNEALPFLKSVNLLPGQFDLPRIGRFQLSACSGRAVTLPLDLGGFGISRYSFDNHLYCVAKSLGVKFRLNTVAENVSFDSGKFHVRANGNSIEADIVVGSFGKKSRLDVVLRRKFTLQLSPYVAVKYHVRTDFPDDLVALHNFEGGYCGVVRIEDGITNLCYLVERRRLKDAGSIPALEDEMCRQNPLLKNIFSNCDFLFEKALVINEVSFATKTPVEGHMLMTGDAGGMIAPVCGNGMAMAVHSGKLASEAILSYCNGEISRAEMELRYRKQWRQHFTARLWFGRNVQRLFGKPRLSDLAVKTIQRIEPVGRLLIRYSHGRPFGGPAP